MSYKEVEEKFKFTKENIDIYLKAVAKEYRKLCGKKIPAELIVVGGASVLINYGFRDMTLDIDTFTLASSVIKDAINRVRDQFELPDGWMNEDFKRTDSYTPNLYQYSTYYKTYSNIVTVRTVSAEYLVAMKLRSGRKYKRDLSDVIGILAEHEKRGETITIEQIKKAVTDLYGDWEKLPESSRIFIAEVTENGNYDELYVEMTSSEDDTKELLIQFQTDYPKVMNESNIDDIINSIKNKQ